MARDTGTSPWPSPLHVHQIRGAELGQVKAGPEGCRGFEQGRGRGAHQQDGGAVEDGLQVHQDGRDARQLLQEAHQQGDGDGPVHGGVPGLGPRHAAALETRGGL